MGNRSAGLYLPFGLCVSELGPQRKCTSLDVAPPLYRQPADDEARPRMHRRSISVISANAGSDAAISSRFLAVAHGVPRSGCRTSDKNGLALPPTLSNQKPRVCPVQGIPNVSN
jgi:hypothetical protein